MSLWGRIAVIEEWVITSNNYKLRKQKNNLLIKKFPPDWCPLLLPALMMHINSFRIQRLSTHPLTVSSYSSPGRSQSPIPSATIPANFLQVQILQVNSWSLFFQLCKWVQWDLLRNRTTVKAPYTHFSWIMLLILYSKELPLQITE